MKYYIAITLRLAIVNARMRKGYTQIKFAKMLGIKSYTLKELGSYSISNEELNKIFKVLDIYEDFIIDIK